MMPREHAQGHKGTVPVFVPVSGVLSVIQRDSQ
jgi:hypothetical protein